MTPGERIDDAASVHDAARLATEPPNAAEPPTAAEPASRRRAEWPQLLGLLVAAAALMLAIAGAIGVVAGSLARLSDGAASDDVLAFVAQGVALVLGSLVVGLVALRLLVRGERRRARAAASSNVDAAARSV